jgi:hypothetical protein
MLFRKTVVFFLCGRDKHTCGQNSELWYVKAGGTYNNHWALESQLKELHTTE